MPTGEGVTNSPSSPLISRDHAGKRRAQLGALELRARDVDARVGDARRVLRGRAAGRARLCLALRLVGGFLRREPLDRAASSSARRRASRRRPSRRLRARASARRVRRAATASSSALMSSFQSSSSSSPSSTRSPFLTGSNAIWPPSAGDRPARRHASTVPARVLATVAATAPRSTVTG